MALYLWILPKTKWELKKEPVDSVTTNLKFVVVKGFFINCVIPTRFLPSSKINLRLFNQNFMILSWLALINWIFRVDCVVISPWKIFPLISLYSVCVFTQIQRVCTVKLNQLNYYIYIYFSDYRCIIICWELNCKKAAKLFPFLVFLIISFNQSAAWYLTIIIKI